MGVLAVQVGHLVDAHRLEEQVAQHPLARSGLVGVAGRVEDRLEAHAFESDADRGVLLAAEPDLPHLRRPALQLAQRDVGLLAGDG